MPDAPTFGLFLAAALAIAVTPGPGIFYVLTRSIQGGRGEGVSSTFGNSLGGLVHVAAAALGLSAVLMASATLFTFVKLAGAAYLVYLGVSTLLARDEPETTFDPAGTERRSKDAFYQGIVVEALNPKTALFLLAFVPQFVDPSGPVVPQIIVLGAISVLSNTVADLVVVFFAGPIGERMRDSARFRRRQRRLTGCALVGLGAYVAVTGEKN